MRRQFVVCLSVCVFIFGGKSAYGQSPAALTPANGATGETPSGVLVSKTLPAQEVVEKCIASAWRVPVTSVGMLGFFNMNDSEYEVYYSIKMKQRVFSLKLRKLNTDVWIAEINYGPLTTTDLVVLMQ